MVLVLFFVDVLVGCSGCIYTCMRKQNVLSAYVCMRLSLTTTPPHSHPTPFNTPPTHPPHLPSPSSPTPHPTQATSPSKQAAETPIPDIEWWDARITQHETYDDVTGDNEQAPLIREERITALVEHPVLIEPPAEAPAPEPQPLKLTRKVH